MEYPSRVLVLGSGAIKVAEAAEFDYSGSQALKALREEGIESILVNPNVATIQTSHRLADKVYLIPLKAKFVEKVIEREMPDGILLGFGGQTALSIGLQLHKRGILSKYGVKVLGTPIEGIERALNRELFCETMTSHGLPIPPSKAAEKIEDALKAAEKIGYPVIVRVSFNLGGRGSTIAWSEKQLENDLARAFAHSEINLVLIEKYLHFWKEIEFEVVRDFRGNSVAVACLENVDPMGIHTGDSVVVAPSQTITNREYYLLRKASLKVAEAIELIGECNVQLALHPAGEEFFIIETNPRMSRSSALASKATGYPLAYIAAKLALGYTLDELLNKVTGVTHACFEPSLDYVVVKVPRWNFDKFAKIERSVCSEMKSIGEVMAIGRCLEEALQKAVRMLDIGEPGLVGGRNYDEPESLHDVLKDLKSRKPYWFLRAAKAFKLGATVDEIYAITGIDKYYLNAIRRVVKLAEELRKTARRGDSNKLYTLIAEAKRLGFSDLQIAKLTRLSEDAVRKARIKHGVIPVVKQIDTLAAEWPAKTNYLYVTYNGVEDDISFTAKKPKIIVLGAGTFRIGVSVEFDWACVEFAEAAKKRGYEVIVVNYNPETVSTDWDVNDKLYFEEISIERILDIYWKENPLGIVVFTGGQIANNIAKKLEEKRVTILGTSGISVDKAEDREKFAELLEKLGIKQPPWCTASSLKEVLRFADQVGYPVIVRPSYVLSGAAMKIAHNESELIEYLGNAAKISIEHPAVVSKFIENALEVEVDAVSDGKQVVGVLLEHIEEAGVHSGDSTMVTPAARKLEPFAALKVKEIAVTLAKELNVKGPFNIQFIVKNGEPYVIELNLRASRSMPFSSKSRGINLMEMAAQAILEAKLKLPSNADFYEPPINGWSVKSPQFSWAQMKKAYPYLGPEMRSTGEAASQGLCFEEALLKSWLSIQPNKLINPGDTVLIYSGIKRHQPIMSKAAEFLANLNVEIYTLEKGAIGNFEKLNADEACKALKEHKIKLVACSGYTPKLDYKIRRLSADLNIPLVLDQNLMLELSKAHNWLYTEGFISIEELSEHLHKKVTYPELPFKNKNFLHSTLHFY